MMVGPGGIAAGEQYLPPVAVVVIAYGLYVCIRDHEQR